MTNSSKDEGDLPLEARMQRLEEILSRMESDEVTLGEALELFEEGVSHVKTAEQVLAAAELAAYDEIKWPNHAVEKTKFGKILLIFNTF